MIYSVKNEKKLNCHTPLLDYIKNTHNYNGEKLIFTDKYSSGTFSIKNKTNNLINCDFINGYPHFLIPEDICISEIMFFLNNERMYNNNFFIRYGDTHPHKPVPKLSQMRNLILAYNILKMIGNAKCYYGLGDISIKSLNDFISKFDINISSSELLLKLQRNELDFSLKAKLEKYNNMAISKINSFLDQVGLPKEEILLESSLYSNQDLYNTIKNNFKENIRPSGDLKYSLQELMFICSILKNKNDVLINIIGANQDSHILEVCKLLLNSSLELDNRFFAYGMCKNAEDNDLERWTTNLTLFIGNNDIKINGRYLTYFELLKILNIIFIPDRVIDFNNLHNYLLDINLFCRNISELKEPNDKMAISSNNLLYKMSLVGYILNKSIELGNPNYYYRYLINIMKEYNLHYEQYRELDCLYYKFMFTGFQRLGFDISNKGLERKKIL